MPTLRIFDPSFQLGQIEGGVVSAGTATGFDHFSVAGYDVMVTGTGLTYDANGILSGGTITQIDAALFDSTVMTWSNLSLSATSYSQFILGQISGQPPVLPNFAAFQTLALGGADAIFGGAAGTVLQGFTGNDVLYGENGDDVLIGGQGRDRYYGGNGTDTVSFETNLAGTGVVIDLTLTLGQIRNDGFGAIETATGIERWVGSSANDTFTGGSSFDTFYGGAGDDSLTGGADSDWLYGGQGNDSLLGGVGVDILFGGTGVDFFDGGADADILAFTSVETPISGIRLDLRLITGNVLNDGYGHRETAINIDNFEATEFGDWMRARMVSEGQPDQLRGLDGDDTMFGGAASSGLIGGNGNDSLQGGTGAETISGGNGSDTMRGGGGIDMLDLWLENFGSAGVVVNLSAATQILNDGWGFAELASGFENVSASEQNDRVSGNSLANWLVGNGGADTLLGGSGDDLIEGGAANDSLSGDLGVDTLYGGGGEDILLAKYGNDSLTGGTEADSFRLGLGTAVVRIADFEAGVDELILDLGAGLPAGAVSSAMFLSGAGLTTAATTSQRLIYDSATGDLWLDRDGTGATYAPTLIAVFENRAALTFGDIAIVNI
jgi:Ca2+-binding RTX toxin-like protein